MIMHCLLAEIDDSGETGDTSTQPRAQDINPQLNNADASDEETNIVTDLRDVKG